MVEIGLDGPDQQLMLCKLYRQHPRPPTHPETSTEASVPGGGMPCPTPAPAPLVAETPSRLAIVRSESAAALTVVIDLCGSSMPPANRLNDMASLVRGLERPVVLLSAMGNTTANIFRTARKALRYGAGKLCEIDELRFIKKLHLRTIDELGLETSTVSGSLDELEHLLQQVARTKELTTWTRDYLVSFGERMSTKLFYEYLNKLEGTLQVWNLRDVAASGRGSIDLTATTIDRAFKFKEIQVWKDVDGIFRCDSMVCAYATLVPYLTFDVAAELSDYAEQALSKFQHFKHLGISVDCVAASGGKMSFTLVSSELSSQELIKLELEKVVEVVQTIADGHPLEDRSDISLTGKAQKSSSIEEKVLTVLQRINAEVHKFSQDSSKVVMKAFLVVEKSRAKYCVHALHSEFLEMGLVSEVGGLDNGSSVIVNPFAESSSGVNSNTEAMGQGWAETDPGFEKLVEDLFDLEEIEPIYQDWMDTIELHSYGGN